MLGVLQWAIILPWGSVPFLLLLLFGLGLVLGPGIWVRWVLWRHDRKLDEIRHTGAGLCNWLIMEYGLLGVSVEETDRGDHYDPRTKTIRLSPRYYGRRSVTATAVALHEFGHALQHRDRYQPLLIRQQVVGITGAAERLASFALLGGPMVAPVAPGATRVLLLCGALAMLAGIPARIVTLPVEFNASFARALPLIREHDLLPEEEARAAHQILLACALTYVASALSGLLSIRRWVRLVLRR